MLQYAQYDPSPSHLIRWLNQVSATLILTCSGCVKAHLTFLSRSVRLIQYDLVWLADSWGYEIDIKHLQRNFLPQQKTWGRIHHKRNPFLLLSLGSLDTSLIKKKQGPIMKVVTSSCQTFTWKLIWMQPQSKKKTPPNTVTWVHHPFEFWCSDFMPRETVTVQNHS